VCEENSPNFSDISLLRRFVDGNDDAATALYTRYANRLLKLANRQVYDDIASQVDHEGIVQSVFRTFFRRASLGQYDVGEKDGLWKLLLVITLNKIRSTGYFNRAAMRDARKTRPMSDEALRTVPGSDVDLALVHLRMTIEELIGKLPVDHQQIILLRIDGHEVNEIATRSGRAKRSVERILQQFRSRLKVIYDSE